MALAGVIEGAFDGSFDAEVGELPPIAIGPSAIEASAGKNHGFVSDGEQFNFFEDAVGGIAGEALGDGNGELDSLLLGGGKGSWPWAFAGADAIGANLPIGVVGDADGGGEQSGLAAESAHELVAALAMVSDVATTAIAPIVMLNEFHDLLLQKLALNAPLASVALAALVGAGHIGRSLIVGCHREPPRQSVRVIGHVGGRKELSRRGGRDVRVRRRGRRR